MSRSLVVGLLAVALSGVATSANALSLLPTVLKSYEAVPRFSTVLLQTGGFGGFSTRYRVRGEMDISFGPYFGVFPTEPPDNDPADIDLSNAVSGFPPVYVDVDTSDPSSFLPTPDPSLFRPPTLDLGSEFVDAELWGTPISDGPVIAIVLDVDEAFNLTELDGTLIPSLNPRFDLYSYNGRTSDGSRVNLFAAFAGDWMYLVGGTTAPDGTADFPEYKIRMLARQTPFTDPSGDAIVSAADYAVARGRGDGVGGLWSAFGADGPDLSVFDWLGGSAALPVTSAVAVPEPTAIAIAIMGLAGAARRRRV